MKTRDQIRAEKASAAVMSLKPELVDEYAAELREFPAMVVHNGIGPTLAFLKARSGPVRNALYDHLSAWLGETVYADKGDLLALVVAQPAARLMRAQEEALVFAAWLRRFAEARDVKPRKS